MEFIEYFSFVLNAVIIITLMLFSRTNLSRVRRILDILSNGGYHDCPFYKKGYLKEKGGDFYGNERDNDN